MRAEIGGAQITETVAETLETLQTQTEVVREYIRTLDDVTRMVILDLSGIDEETDSRTLSRLRALQMIRRDILLLATPPEVDDIANDEPATSL